MSVTNEDIEANNQADKEQEAYIDDTRESLKVLIEGLIEQELDPKHWIRPKATRDDFIKDIIQPILLDYIIETREE